MLQIQLQSLSIAFPVRGGAIRPVEHDTSWSFGSGNGAFSCDTWFTLKTW